MLLKKINLKIMLFKQIRALGISQVGKPFKLDVSVTPEGMGWALWNLKKKKRTKCPLAFAPNYQRGQIRYTPIEEQLLAVCTALLQVETLTKKKVSYSKNFLSHQGADRQHALHIGLCCSLDSYID